MSFVERRRPRFSETEASEIAQSLYRTKGILKELPSERDQNFYLRDSSGKEFVLKIASTLEPEETLQMQNKAMGQVAERTGEALTPRICRNVQNKDMATILDSQGLPHLVRMFTFLPGIPLALFRPHSKTLLQNLGKGLARIDHALQGFDHASARRDLRWDFDRAEWVITHFGRHVQSNERLQILNGFLTQWRERILPELPTLRKSVVYHDANEYNVLVSQETFDSEPAIGFIDFGDMLYTYTVAEPAISAAYAMLEKSDPLFAATEVIHGYHSVLPLTEKEIGLLYYFISMRLCLSVSICAFQQQEEPQNEYLKISERPAWDLLMRWKSIHPRFAEYVFRQACGFSAHPKNAAILQWFEEHQKESAPCLTGDFTTGDYGEIREVGPHSNVPGGVESFRIQTNDGFDWRSIHLGLDYFAEPGTAVYSPFEGTIHSFQNNVGAGDYGPTVVLRVPAADHEFSLLFGHLSFDSLLGLYPGKAIAKGARIGRIGTFEENGNWKPHVHLQVILDLLDQSGTFPGLCSSSQKKIWFNLCPDPNRISGKENPAKNSAVSALVARRKEHISKSLSISYKTPLNIVKGRGQYLFDENGAPYLDCVNNVCHVGHSHPKVIEAAQKQMKELNTNTRYLHQNLVEYADRLCSKLPEPLRVCFFVCSGSEANDLALRLARAYTGNKNTIVLDGAYHGNLSSLIEISPYKFDGPGGNGAPAHVQKALMPDLFRGPYSGSDAGAQYAEDVRTKISNFPDHQRVTFLAESALGCGGQIILPEGYLSHAFRHVREAGGVCIVDEVQVGFGRVGTHFWCFETQNVVPDIVTMGKPIGNGHPMAAVVTTREIAAAFENGMEYFNTFGGNPVSCAIGLAVLDVIEQEGLQEHAREVGQYMKAGLDGLKQLHPLIGDVRGLGLFMGVELVKDPIRRMPLPKHASYIVERMRDRALLLSTDGPDHNVLKIKPPLVFTRENADELLENLDIVLRETVLS